MNNHSNLMAAAVALALAATLIGGPIPVAAATASKTSAPLSVDARDLGCRRTVSPASLTYSPYWLSATDGSTRSTRIEVVTDPDTAKAATNALVTGGAGLAAAYAWTPPAAAKPFCRLLHWTLDGGAPTGAPIICDVVIGTPSAAGTAFAGDTRTNSLQEIANANGLALLTYSPLWFADGTSVRIERIRRRGISDAGTTNSLTQTSAGAEGAYPLGTGALPSGIYTLRHLTLNASGTQTGDVLTTAEFFIRRPEGTLIRVL